MVKLGTVISHMDSPNTNRFVFVINDDATSFVKKGQFVEVEHNGGKLIGMISDVFRSNRYFERAESVAEYERVGMLSANFPVDDWSYTIAEVKIVGVYKKPLFERCSFPPAPGSEVLEVDEALLKVYLGFDERGLNIGKLFNHNVEVKLNLSKLFQKHLAILAMSGAGKSYLMSVMLEELLERSKEEGRVGIIVFDVHGEYVNLKKSALGDKVKVYDGEKMRIGMSNLPINLLPFYGELTSPQKRSLRSIMKDLRKRANMLHKPFTLKDLIAEIEMNANSDEKKKNAKTYSVLIENLESLLHMNLFGAVDEPNINSLVNPGNVSVINFRNIDNERKRQTIVSYLAKSLFDRAKRGLLPPFILVLEEAHNFAAERARNEMISRSAIETIAREGRKFGVALCLITQRPVKLSSTVLSQCNTHIILRVTNPNDIKHIGESSEGIDSYMLSSITTLQVGEAMVVGEAVKRPLFLKVRKRKYDWYSSEISLEDLAIKYEKEKEKKLDDSEAFL